METLAAILINLVSTMIDHVNMFLSSQTAEEMLILSSSGLTVAFALGVVSPGSVTEGVMNSIRRWHGNIDDQFAAIDNLVGIITSHQPTWTIPADLLARLTTNRNELQTSNASGRKSNVKNGSQSASVVYGTFIA
jgi:hypothetical protein